MEAPQGRFKGSHPFKVVNMWEPTNDLQPLGGFGHLKRIVPPR